MRIEIYSETVYDAEGYPITYYGLCFSDAKTEKRFSQLTSDQKELLAFVQRLQEGQLHPIHIQDCVEDFVAQQVTV